MGIINNKNKDSLTDSLPPQDNQNGGSENICATSESPEVIALKTQLEVANARILELQNKIVENEKEFRDKVIEISTKSFSEPKDERSELEKMIDKSIAFLNKGKQRKNI